MGMIDDERKQAAAYAEAVRRDGQLSDDERVAYNATARALGTPRRYLRYGSTHGMLVAGSLPGAFAPGGLVPPPSAPPPGAAPAAFRLLALDAHGDPAPVRVDHVWRWR